MSQRLRITYAVDHPIAYASHLDRAAVWSRTARRAGLLLVHSGGFNPRPRIQFASALPVGFTAREELLDLWVAEEVDLREAHGAVARAAPEGLTLVGMQEVDLAEPALPTRVLAAEYAVTLEPAEPAADVHSRIEQLLAEESLPRRRRGRPYDLRPLVERLWLEAERPEGTVLGMVLAARDQATGRPEEVLDSLGLSGRFFRVCRRRLLLEQA